jgi:putative ABC transport system ATP-binding protein
MKLEFKNVMPHPLEAYQHHENSVWRQGVSLTFPQKVLLNASSGKGKSTFINTIFGVRKDYSGDIFIDDQLISRFSIDDWVELRRRTLSVVFQDLQLFPELTVWENLILKNNLTNHKTEAEIEEMLALLGIADKKAQTARTLSLGQQQRVAIIRSLLQPFKLLLMDEPFSHLDEANSAIALTLIASETDKNDAGFILSSLGSKHGFNYDSELKL